jgi:hypothetical protein
MINETNGTGPAINGPFSALPNHPILPNGVKVVISDNYVVHTLRTGGSICQIRLFEVLVARSLTLEGFILGECIELLARSPGSFFPFSFFPQLMRNPGSADFILLQHLEHNCPSPPLELYSVYMTYSRNITHAYRALYRTGLHAVRYSRPARYVIRDRLRRAFRDSDAKDFEPRRIANTILFLKAAARDRGLEHRVVKSLCHVWYMEQEQWKRRSQLASKHSKTPIEASSAIFQSYDQFYEVLRLLNETMGLCLR